MTRSERMFFMVVRVLQEEIERLTGDLQAVKDAMLADIAAPIRKVFDMKSDDRASYHYNAARAAAAIIVQAHGRLDLVLAVLQRIRADEKFVNGYRDPKKIVAALDGEIGAAKLAKRRRTMRDRIIATALTKKRDRKPNTPDPRYELHDGKWVLTPWEKASWRAGVRVRRRRTTKGKVRKAKR